MLTAVLAACPIVAHRASKDRRHRRQSKHESAAIREAVSHTQWRGRPLAWRIDAHAAPFFTNLGGCACVQHGVHSQPVRARRRLRVCTALRRQDVGVDICQRRPHFCVGPLLTCPTRCSGSLDPHHGRELFCGPALHKHFATRLLLLGLPRQCLTKAPSVAPGDWRYAPRAGLSVWPTLRSHPQIFTMAIFRPERRAAVRQRRSCATVAVAMPPTP
jgi:hypothetical protein